MTRSNDGISLSQEVDPEASSLTHLRAGRGGDRKSTAVTEPRDEKLVEFSEKKIQKAMEIASDALQDLSEMAQASEDPKAYAAVSRLLDSIAMAGDRLVGLRGRTTADEPPTQQDAPSAPHINDDETTIIFKGSNTQLQKLLEETKKED